MTSEDLDLTANTAVAAMDELARRWTAVEAVRCTSVLQSGNRVGEECGAKCLPGQVVCRKHGGGIEVITRAAAEVRLEAARGVVASQLGDAVVAALGVFLDVLNDDQAAHRDRLAAADRIIALAGGPAAITESAAEAEASSAQSALLALLQVAPDERLERLARRLGAIPAETVTEP